MLIRGEGDAIAVFGAVCPVGQLPKAKYVRRAKKDGGVGLVQARARFEFFRDWE
jgi:hypothetical protein